MLAATLWSPTVTFGQLEILDLVLEKKVNVDVEMPMTKKTALHVAVSHGLVHATERLLENGADPARRTSDGKCLGDFANDRKEQHGCLNCFDCENIEKLIATLQQLDDNQPSSVTESVR